MTIEEVMALAAVCETPRDWSEVRNHIEALVAQARDEEAEACAEIVMAEQATPHGLAYCEAAIRARIAGRKA